jgi:hypothetical protein
LSSRAVRQQLQAPGVRLDEELTRMSGLGMTVHLLADGGAIVLLPDGTGTLWTSRDNLFRRVRQATDVIETGADEMAQLTPHDESFAALPPLIESRHRGERSGLSCVVNRVDHRREKFEYQFHSHVRPASAENARP